jgi:uncharacterized protein (TIGR00661 family)
MPRPQKILVCPLDWGLGHATRCIPIIRSLIERGVEVHFASSGPALELLKMEFPSVRFFELPSYNPEYSHSDSLVGKMLRQLPKFRKIIAAEHAATEDIVRQNGIDVVISDNRYGCYASGVESIFVTHQPKVVMPDGYGWAAPGVNWVLHQHIRNFSRVWIPDQPDSHLTEPFYSNVVQNQQYIGWLSRFDCNTSVNPNYKIAAIISGPEPQRSILEKKIRRELATSKAKSVMVLGQPGPLSREIEDNVTIFNHLPAGELQRVIQGAETVLSRSGYSTIMDLIALKKNAIFIPTPGQPEQTVLANYLDKKKYAVARSQDEFRLEEALDVSLSYKGMGAFNMDKRYLAAALDSIF